MDDGINKGSGGFKETTRLQYAGRPPHNNNNSNLGSLMQQGFQRMIERNAQPVEAPLPEELRRTHSAEGDRKRKAAASPEGEQFGVLYRKELRWLRDCSFTARWVYALLLTFRDPETWETFVPIGCSLIAAETGYSADTVKRAIRELKDKGKIRRKEGTGNGRGNRSVYVFTRDPFRGDGSTRES